MPVHPQFVTYKGERFRIQTSGRYYQSGRKDVAERLLHRRVWSDAHGPIPAGHVIHHIDGDWANNDLANLQLRQAGEHQSSHLKERWGTEEYRQRALNALDSIRDKASEWHRSPEGLRWHQQNGRRAWEGRATHLSVCVLCGESFPASFATRARFCSRSCEQKASYQRHKTSTRLCELCGKEFVANKYRRNRFCSRACSVRAIPRGFLA